MKIKKLLSVILAAVMLLGCMSVTAFADDEEELFDVTINFTEQDVPGAVYETTRDRDERVEKEAEITTISTEHFTIDFTDALHKKTEEIDERSGEVRYVNRDMLRMSSSSDITISSTDGKQTITKVEIIQGYYYVTGYDDLGQYFTPKDENVTVEANGNLIFSNINSDEITMTNCWFQESEILQIKVYYTQSEEPTDPDFTIDANGVLTAYTGEGGDIVIPNGVTAIGMRAFKDNTAITSVVIPNGVTSIGSSAFSGCSSLTSVTIPSSVTSIAGQAFYRCTGLTSVTIPPSVTSIGSGAFYTNTKLAELTLGWDGDNIKSVLGAGFSSSSLPEVLHVPAGTKAAYAEKGWNCTIVDDAIFPLSSFTLSKDYNNKYSTSDSDAKSTKVSETLSFTITPVDDAPAFANSGAVSMTVTKGVGSAVVALPAFPSTGDFWYTITETAGTTAGVTYNDATHYLHLVVYKIDGAYSVVSTAIHTTAPLDGVYSEDDKIKSVSNSYGEGSLTVGQVTTINGENSSEDTFEATVTFTIPEGTVLSGDITYGDNQKVTFDENGVGTVVIELKGGDTVTFTGIPEGVTYTVTQTEGNEDMGYTLDSVAFDVTDETGDTVTDLVASGTIGDAADTVTITNTKTVPIDVGVILENGAFIFLALGALALGAYLVIAKRKEQDYQEEV